MARPKKKNLDVNTRQQLNEADELELMCMSKGWGVAKSILMKDILELGDITSLTELDPNKLIQEVAGRQMAISLLDNWLRKIDSKIKNKNAYHETYIKHVENSFINYGEEE